MCAWERDSIAADEGAGAAALDKIESYRSPKIPAFYREDPTLWFAVVESTFRTSHITAESTMADFIARELDYEIAATVRDLCLNVPRLPNVYTLIKERIIAMYGQSPETNLCLLLKVQVLTDGRPSLTLARLKNLNNGACDDSVLMSLFMELIQPAHRPILASTVISDPDKLAAVADRLNEYAGPEGPSISVARAPALGGTPVAAALAPAPGGHSTAAEPAPRSTAMEVMSRLCQGHKELDRLIILVGKKVAKSGVSHRLPYAITGADLLEHYGLLVDLRRGRLVDSMTSLYAVTTAKSVVYSTVSSIVPDPRVKHILADFPEVFGIAMMPPSKSVDVLHHILTTGPPVSERSRRLNPDKLRAAKKEFEALIAAGICRPSSSPWASPIHMALKKDGTWRVCGDYGGLNKQTIPDKILGDLDFVFVYIDDILIASESEQEHMRHINIVLRRLQEHHLRVNLTKCVFAVKEIEFLGYLVSPQGIRLLESAAKAISQFQRPKRVIDLRHFLGMVNFYRRNIPHAARLQAPLNEFIRDSKKHDAREIKWTKEAIDASVRTREALVKAALLAHPRSATPAHP
ncbi:uncharacterized protein LOC143261000 [Megalopta genalis]|uniref:uncharacterized protein LOC143261000 n=1 Tax=Megalopta genalis TaxID=115081 RepID=UPI003FCF08DC